MLVAAIGIFGGTLGGTIGIWLAARYNAECAFAMLMIATTAVRIAVARLLRDARSGPILVPNWFRAVARRDKVGSGTSVYNCMLNVKVVADKLHEAVCRRMVSCG